jgi:hypothetical protein
MVWPLERHHGAGEFATRRRTGKVTILLDPSTLQNLGARAPESIRLSDGDHLAWVRTAAESIEETGAGRAELVALDAAAAPDVPVAARLALKLAASRAAVREFREPTHLSVLFAVYREHTRIRRPEEHPHGEDFLRRKLDQLEWLFELTPRHSWDLTVVDDGCPEGSGLMAQEVLNEFPDVEARVLFLDEAIRTRLPIVAGLESTHDSRKGGSIRYGMWDAAGHDRPDHVVLFTDADLSTHLAQAGLLLDPIIREHQAVAIGSRRHPSSVVLKEGARDNRGKLFIYLWKRLVPQLRGITDTQCGFKAFRADAMRAWIEEVTENGFAFDIEFLLRAERTAPGSISTVPLAWIDSDAASTTTDLQPYLPMLRSVARFYRQILPPDPSADTFASLIESLSQEEFERLLQRIPSEIADRDPTNYDEFAGITAAELARLAGL